MGGASFPSGGELPMDDGMNQQPPMGGQPMAMGSQEMPPMDSEINQQPPMDDGGMGGNEDMTPPEGGSEIDDVFNQLSDTDKKATLSYAQSLLDRSEEEKSESHVPDDGGMQHNSPIQPMREFRKINGRLVREEFGIMNQSKEKSGKASNKKLKAHPNSPFSSPLK